ncbi:MAG: glycosyltransferase family 2 protein [Bifidobacteriaceae bacterium]|nr:glycosyltransferase family 2 protein [Bifidobacteriaceae bacterium]
MNTGITLSFVIPAYNMEQYLTRCVTSILSTEKTDDIEIIIVDDGSKDGTAALADSLQREHPNIKAVHQENKGHGGAVNNGIAHATGEYVKIVDADDWVDKDAYKKVIEFLRKQVTSQNPIDLFITNYMYDSPERHTKHEMHMSSFIPKNTLLTWDDISKPKLSQYLIMHTLIYRTEILRQSKLQLPEHTFYVDFIYSYQPLPWVKTMYYMDIPFYHYFIGREGQSVETKTMIKKVNQLRLVNECMVDATPKKDSVSRGLYQYMTHYLALQTSVTSAFLILSHKKENYAIKQEVWENIRKKSPTLYKDISKSAFGRIMKIPGLLGRSIVRSIYWIAKYTVGFN